MEPFGGERTFLGVDEADWALALGGDGAAFERIFDRHHDRVQRHAVALVPVFADAEDVVAVAFLEAWRLRRRVRLVEGSVLPWLLVTATNISRNLSRSVRRYGRAVARLPRPDDVGVPDGDQSAVAALRGLSLDDQRVVTLCVLYEYTAAEAAAVLGVPVGTVKSRLSRARARLATEVTAAQGGTA